MRGLARDLIMKGKITTTQAKAKSLRPYAEKLITQANKNNLAAFKTLVSQIGTAATRKLTQETVPKFASRSGGYTRITNLPPRVSDGAKMAIIQLVE